MGKIIITKLNNRLLFSLFDTNKPTLLQTVSIPGTETLLNAIFLAKVKDIVPGIHGAFLTISGEQTVYLSLHDNPVILVANREMKENDTLKVGDEIVIQISQEALKSKQPTASTKLSLTGQYCVCDYFGHGLHYSKKISSEKKQEIDTSIRHADITGRKKYSFTIRTNAEALTDFSVLYAEMENFINIFDLLTNNYKHRTCYSCLYKPEAEIISLIKDIPFTLYEEIVTDVEEIFLLIKDNLNNSSLPIDINIRLYQDSMLPLSKLYSMEKHIREALSKQVWLPCGGYLIIEPTEAMTVIDVNSGKADASNKKGKDYILKINLEAAKEVARQLRLRNYSGMIMVDFINMKSEKDNEILLNTLDLYLKEDKIKTRLVDMTALGIVEITRKKVNRPLADFFKNHLT